MTPLHIAAIHNQLRICQKLIKHNANIRCCDQNLATPLHYACTEGNVELVAELIATATKANKRGDDNEQNVSFDILVSIT